jgi:acetyl-CoA carboxylase biotin carboxyl carrier protein
MDLRKLKKLIDLVEESGIAELELTEGEEKVKISRQLMNQATPMTLYTSASTNEPSASNGCSIRRSHFRN